jgi:signal transduction histidine kinase
MLTHELKTPLSVIRLVLGSKAPAPALVAHAERAARDMNAVIERCLQAEQLADQQFTMQAQTVNLRDELQQLQRNSPSAERLHLSIPSDVPLKTDAKLLHIVLGNLLDNALKYSAAGSAVHILVTDQARHGQAGWSVCVQNIPGVAGWPDGTRVFQKYYRSPSAHHQTGSGLGLFLVHGMAQVLGGELSYASDEIFVKFKLWLPHSTSSL